MIASGTSFVSSAVDRIEGETHKSKYSPIGFYTVSVRLLMPRSGNRYKHFTTYKKLPMVCAGKLLTTSNSWPSRVAWVMGQGEVLSLTGQGAKAIDWRLSQ